MPETNQKNKLKFKLKRCYYAPATIDDDTGVVSYSKPVRIPLSVSVTLNPKGELIKIYADGQEHIIGNDNSGYDGEAEMYRIPEDFEVGCLGAVRGTDGTVLENANGKSTPFAMLFEFEGDAKAIRHCMYLCYANRFTVDGTNSESKTPTSEKLSIVSRPRADGWVKTKTGDSTDKEVYDNWYNAVPEPPSTEAEAATVNNGEPETNEQSEE